MGGKETSALCLASSIRTAFELGNPAWLGNCAHSHKLRHAGLSAGKQSLLPHTYPWGTDSEQRFLLTFSIYFSKTMSSFYLIMELALFFSSSFPAGQFWEESTSKVEEICNRNAIRLKLSYFLFLPCFTVLLGNVCLPVTSETTREKKKNNQNAKAPI